MVNTTLELGGENLSSGFGGAAPKKRKRLMFDEDDDEETVDDVDPHVYNPMPLQWYMPEGGVILNLGFFGKKKKKKNYKSKKKPRRNDDDVVVDHNQVSVPSIEEFPEVLQAIESIHGSRPVFLYSKKLEGSDVRASQNRLFLTNRETLVEKFLSAEEVAAVDTSKEGLTNIVGVDERGNRYMNLKMKKWVSLDMTVINSDWNKMVAVNNGEKGDFVLIWGFRCRNGELGLVVVFRKP